MTLPSECVANERTGFLYKTRHSGEMEQKRTRAAVQAALFERAILHPSKVSPLVAQRHPEALGIFKDALRCRIPGLTARAPEADLHQGVLNKLKDFLLELGRDFCFVGSE